MLTLALFICTPASFLGQVITEMHGEYPGGQIIGASRLEITIVTEVFPSPTPLTLY